jgi:hypothetical protein
MLPTPSESKNDSEDAGSRVLRNMGPCVTVLRHSQSGATTTRYTSQPPSSHSVKRDDEQASLAIDGPVSGHL